MTSEWTSRTELASMAEPKVAARGGVRYSRRQGRTRISPGVRSGGVRYSPSGLTKSLA
jgi:hypothetical protein